MRVLDDLVAYLRAYLWANPESSKTDIENAVATQFGLERNRAAYHDPHFAIRFSQATGKGFSNTVASLALVHKYDSLPFLVCVIRSGDFEIMLANSTFLRKVSHSSHTLSLDNVRGSFLGHDILREFSGLQNIAQNFDALFEMHLQFEWEENLSRLVEATSGIAATIPRYQPDDSETLNILSSPDLALWLASQEEYRSLARELDELVGARTNAILTAASIDNVNVRGNTIEQILTSRTNIHGLDDFSRTLSIGPTVKVDIKTKILALKSNPKGYNIDKFLRTLALGSTVFDFYLIGIDIENALIATCLISAIDERIIDATRVQFHWAGRKSRGVTQLTGDLSGIIKAGSSDRIDTTKAKQFLQGLVDL